MTPGRRLMLLAFLLTSLPMSARAEEYRTDCEPTGFGGGVRCKTSSHEPYERHSGVAAALNTISEGMRLEMLSRQSQPQVVYVPVPQTQAPQSTRAKFCPVGGELYEAQVNYCPHHGVELQAYTP